LAGSLHPHSVDTKLVGDIQISLCIIDQQSILGCNAELIQCFFLEKRLRLVGSDSR
jgi:hypothetical protein